MSGLVGFERLFNYFLLFFGLALHRFLCVSLSQSFLLSRLCQNSRKGCFATLEKILGGTGACLAVGSHRAEQTLGEPGESKYEENRKDPQSVLAFVLCVLGRLWWVFIPQFFHFSCVALALFW